MNVSVKNTTLPCCSITNIKKPWINQGKKLGFNEYSLLPDMEHCANYVKSLEKDIKE